MSFRSAAASLASLLLAVVFVASPVLGSSHKPKMALTADPAFGFTPVTVVLTGHLTGVDLHDRNFCHAAISWVRIDPGQTERDGFRIREDPACAHPDEEISVSTTFTKTFVLYRPGSYLVRLEVEGKDGTRVVSSFARVEVLRVQ